MMSRAVWSVPILLLAFSAGRAELEKDRPAEVDQLSPPMGVHCFVDTFKAGKEARAIAVGKGKTCLAVYVFDRHGNCVAWKDVSSPRTSDDLAVVWVPIATARYDVEIRNAGYESNLYQLALR